MNFRSEFLIFPVRKELKLTILPVFPQTVCENMDYELEIKPFSGLRLYGLRDQAGAPTEENAAFFQQRHPLRVENSMLVMDVSFPQEDGYVCRLFIGGKEAQLFEIYALEEDLFHLNPYRGDNHMHTWMSDGKDSPMYMAAAACRNGNDYCVITDHRKYEPSLIAKEFYEGTGVDFLVIPGEEIHSPDNHVHIINLGGTESVNDWWRDHEDEYRAAVEKEMESMDVPMTDKDRYAAAASQVIFDRIESVDGVSVFCHPCWILSSSSCFQESEDITEYLMDHKRFTALELIAGGAYEVGTQMQISYYQKRESMPILGSSDAHSCFGGRGKLEPGNYTIAFAQSMDPASIKTAIRSALTVAGNENKLYGDFRLVKYAYFLMRSYYPKHSEQRMQLGAKMLRYASSLSEKDSAIAQEMQNIRPTEEFVRLRWHD